MSNTCFKNNKLKHITICISLFALWAVQDELDEVSTFSDALRAGHPRVTARAKSQKTETWAPPAGESAERERLGSTGTLKEGPPTRCPFSPSYSGWEGSPSKIDYRKKGSRILTSLLEDLGWNT